MEPSECDKEKVCITRIFSAAIQIEMGLKSIF